MRRPIASIDFFHSSLNSRSTAVVPDAYLSTSGLPSGSVR